MPRVPFEGHWRDGKEWNNPADAGSFSECRPVTFLRQRRGASHVAVAMEDGQVVGFVYAVSDGVLSV
ncbi:hypothetical protein [Deinococcus enclensis]|uniref:Uncharacterized protein n=1 Tax=Deinococcus enclensis TaxID=1049582 RepID=A0ABT9M8C0_9DEIO|nr:hypothetical protein [Deinococcus enclensis]MDP9762826.1 hypothetical protein [Deinococcus enclensis]GHF78222.1 hypothetical protein GCM10017782_15280 [Deinococcus ficus]